ncbi:hypothetical protein, partial [Fischerella thermalis]|uniref:hypothetical protein n=1 Tax=Fischerella thermalis TaxID=372787 RepID=UPI001CA557DB
MACGSSARCTLPGKGTTVRRGILGAGASGCPHPLCPHLRRGGRGELWSAEAKLPPDAQAQLQHSKQVCARDSPLPQ